MYSVLECLHEIGKLLEGGRAFGGVRPIKKSEVKTTFSEFEKQVFVPMGLKKKAIMIGSAVPLQKDEYGDIDTAVDARDIEKLGGFEGMVKKTNKLKFAINAMPGLRIISVKFPIYNDKGQKTKHFAQIDVMVGKRVWLEFWSFTPVNTQFKAVYRNLLMQSTFRLVNQIITHDPTQKYSMSHLGLRMKTIEKVPITRGAKKGGEREKTTKVKMLTNTPKGMVKVLNELTGKKFSMSDFNSFETILNALKKNLKKTFFNAIVKNCKEEMIKQGYVVPDELE